MWLHLGYHISFVISGKKLNNNNLIFILNLLPEKRMIFAIHSNDYNIFYPVYQNLNVHLGPDLAYETMYPVHFVFHLVYP